MMNPHQKPFQNYPNPPNQKFKFNQNADVKPTPMSISTRNTNFHMMTPEQEEYSAESELIPQNAQYFDGNFYSQGMEQIHDSNYGELFDPSDEFAQMNLEGDSNPQVSQENDDNFLGDTSLNQKSSN